MYFKLIGNITDIQTIATSGSIGELERLKKIYGSGRWLKRKGQAQVELFDGSVHWAEIHWYEAHGIGRKEMKIKRFLD